MATQIVILKRKKNQKRREEEARLAAEQGKAAPELPAFSNGKRPPAGRLPAGLESDTSDAEFRYGRLGLEDGLDAVEEQDRTIVSRVYDIIKETKYRQTQYCNLLSFLIFTGLYMTVLYMQQNSALVYQLTTANSAILPEGSSFTYANDIYAYINDTFVNTIWADPVCGDGVCDRPIEFNGFGRFGCTPDCGAMDTVPVAVSFETDFKTAQDQADAEWNVCMTYPDNLCWFDTNQRFADQSGAYETTLNLPNGTWEVRLTSPGDGVSGKATTQIVDPLGAAEDIKLSSWGTCKPDAESDLVRCRSICAKSVGCAVDACSNVNDRTLAGLFVDCIGLCNANVTALDPYQNLNCLQIVSLANSSKHDSFFTASGRVCTLDPIYVSEHPDQAATLTARAQAPVKGSDLTGGRRRLASSGRRLSQAGTGTELYWQQFGNTDVQRFRNLATAVSRALNTWIIDSCLAKYYMPPTTTGPKMLGFFCAYFGGPATLPGCSYTDATTSTTLTSADVDALHAVLERKYGAGSPYNISQPEQNRFITILENALYETIGFTLSDADLVNVGNHLHDTDAQVVQQEVNNCNLVNVVLPWKLDVHYVTNITAGDSIQFVWADDFPHAVKGKLYAYPSSSTAGQNMQDSADIFNGFGTGRRVISTGSLCSPENVGAGENGSFLTDPVPCVVRSDNVLKAAQTATSAFSFTQVFTQPGVYEYLDSRFGSSMTGTVYVSPKDKGLPQTVTTEDQRECAPGCPIRLLANGRCGASFGCNSVECAFDGGDCSCPDPATVLATTSGGSGTNNLCKCPPGQIRSDDGACCQAEPIGQDYRATFEVVIVNNQESLFDPSNCTRTRYATNHNRIIGGLYMRQKRYGGELCKDKRFLSLFQYCIDGESIAPFGVDPVFVPTSSLFNPDQVANIGDYYSPEEITFLGVPMGFYSEDSGKGDPGFPIVFDINLDQAGAQARLQTLADGLFLDNATDSLLLHLVTYNGESHFFVSTEVRLTFQRAGKIAVNTNINAVDVQPYRRPIDYLLACLEIIVACSIFFGAYKEIAEAISIRRKKGTFWPYFAQAWNYIDLASLTLLVTAVVMRIVFVAYLAPTFHARARYEIYESLTQPARFFQLKKDGSELHDFTHLLEKVHYLISYDAVYAGINGINIFFMILRILKHMHFQPRMGVLTRTLVEAGPDILNFFILWTIVFLGYSFMGHIVFGRSVDFFRSLGWSITSCFLLILGDTSFEYNLMTLQGWEFGAGQFFFWTFNWFIVFIIMNFLIAIAVDAFVDVKEKTETAPTMPEEIAEYAYWYIQSVVNKRLSQRKLLKQLKVWRRKARCGATKAGDAKCKELDTHDEEEAEEESELVLKLDGKNIDGESLQSIFERRCQMEDRDGSADRPERIAKQILVEYGEHVKKQFKQPKKPKKNAELLELKDAVRNLELRMRDIGDLLHGRLDAIHSDLAAGGLARSVIPEGREDEEDDGMDDGDEGSDGADSDNGGPTTRRNELFEK
ncbi:Ca2+-modulated nonselective cation channel polycystin [Klebsormidium nitens]|uniref:Ca2+-modulated nonselective cation channel polycystin n=1 Tax=Klebsormidium nitens TaxID=105231 RepID=A0A1Y1I4E4_KLENI|nr:Ca2+-modulated nonselective cation channel polycystin [Klebsormidium nitens]|eukprot:GAQ83617.1 Ca2+-modulated nonselective cation channel polycystin [Klebsormidium nitens]